MRQGKKKASDLCKGQKPNNKKHGHMGTVPPARGAVNDEYQLILLQEEIILARIDHKNMNWQSGHYC